MSIAQETEPVAEVIVPVYQVEVLVFRHLDQSQTTGETRSEPEPALPGEFGVGAAQGSTNKAAAGLSADAPQVPGSGPLLVDNNAPDPVEFVLLEPVPSTPDFVQLGWQQFMLVDVEERLYTIDAYEPVAHFGWLQTARGAADAVAFDLVVTGINPEMLTGTVTLYKQRFLHLEVDIALSNDPDAGTSSPQGFWSKIMPLIEDRKMMHEIDQSRRIREGLLQYFDHPNFGVIATVTEIIDEEEELPPETGTL